jgi:beta-phosphoglucomutase-like phosphatase (HAD superfamily)
MENPPLSVSTTDYRTAGEPFRIMSGGVGPIPGGTVLDKREWATENLARFVEVGLEIKDKLNATEEVSHPLEPRLRDVFGTIFFEDARNDGGFRLAQRNVTVFADGEVDRSPCGSGTSARLALLHAEGRLAAGESLEHSGIVGTRFVGRVVEETKVAGIPAAVTEVEGSARPTGHHRLAIISNTDDGLFALTARYLEVEFDYIVTAEQAGTYKPSPNNFELALERIGVAPEKLLHVAESLFHDHVPAKVMGLDTAWIHRRAAKGGFGATPPAEAEPDLEVPDLESLVSVLGSRQAEASPRESDGS